MGFCTIGVNCKHLQQYAFSILLLVLLTLFSYIFGSLKTDVYESISIAWQEKYLYLGIMW